MEKKACLKILAAASLWGCIGVFLKLLTAAGFTSIQGVALRGVVSVLAYGGFLLAAAPGALRIRPGDWYLFFGTGVCSLLFFNWCYFNAISASSMSVAAVLLYTSPVFVALMSALFFKERLTPAKLAALAVTFLGCVLVTGLLPLGQRSVGPMTILFGLGAGFGYALYSIIGKFALAKYSSSTVTFYTLVFCTVFALPMADPLSIPARLNGWQAWAGALGIGVLCCTLPYCLYTDGLRHVEAGKAAILATIEPFVATLLGILAYHEAVTPYKLLGMAAILGAVVLLNRPERSR